MDKLINLAPADFPNNSQMALFFREFLQCGYRSSSEAIVVKFPYGDGSRALLPFTVGITDGLTKVLIMFSIIGFMEELELTNEEVKMLEDTMVSFQYLRCTYEHFQNPTLHFLHGLRLWAADSALFCIQ